MYMYGQWTEIVLAEMVMGRNDQLGQGNLRYSAILMKIAVTYDQACGK